MIEDCVSIFAFRSHHFTKRSRWTVTFSVLGLLSAGSGPLPAAEPAEGPAASQSTPVDKSQYNLFHPVPSDQLRDMETDRPNVTNSPHTIDPGHLQLESGLVEYNFNRDHYHGQNLRTDLWTLGQMNYRVGILDNFEINALINPYVFTRTQDHLSDTTTRASGIGDIMVGGKISVFGNDSTDAGATWNSALAIQPQFTLPSIDDRIGSGYFQYSINVPYEINLPRNFHLDVQPTIAHLRNTTNSGDVTTFQGAVSLDRAIVGKLDAYVEYVTIFSTERHTEPVQTLNVGATYPLTENLQLDTGFFIGLNHATPTLDVTIGISVRF